MMIYASLSFQRSFHFIATSRPLRDGHFMLISVVRCFVVFVWS